MSAEESVARVGVNRCRPGRFDRPCLLVGLNLFEKLEQVSELRITSLWATFADESHTSPKEEQDDPVWGQFAAGITSRLAACGNTISILSGFEYLRPTAPNFLTEAACVAIPPLEVSIWKRIANYFTLTDGFTEPLWLTDMQPLQIPDFHLQVLMSYSLVSGVADGIRVKFINGKIPLVTSADFENCEFMVFPEFFNSNFNDTSRILIAHRNSISQRVDEAVSLAAADSKITVMW